LYDAVTETESEKEAERRFVTTLVDYPDSDSGEECDSGRRQENRHEP
jgi:hypothetical protein